MTQEEFTTEELTFAAHDKIDALIDLLIEKKVITEDEYVSVLKNLHADEYEEHQKEEADQDAE